MFRMSVHLQPEIDSDFGPAGPKSEAERDTTRRQFWVAHQRMRTAAISTSRFRFQEKASGGNSNRPYFLGAPIRLSAETLQPSTPPADKPGMWQIFFAAAFLLTVFVLFHEPQVQAYPLNHDLGAPRQTAINRGTPWSYKQAQITPLADYEVDARVLATERYRFDHGATFAPLDFALGWGEMSDFSYRDKLNISQSGRFYWYSWGSEGPPLPKDIIIRSSSNHHLIPADDGILELLAEVKPGDVVHLKGKLVRIDESNGGHWISSLSRTDSGGGACELLWVEEVVLDCMECDEG